MNMYISTNIFIFSQAELKMVSIFFLDLSIFSRQIHSIYIVLSIITLQVLLKSVEASQWAVPPVS